ncbi:MAG: DUF167 domain-containing protein [Methanoregula sp.]|nr:MAG: DUF167 domain-containing protein [Methanoregula sp.]
MPSCADAISNTKNGIIITIEVTAGSRSNTFPAGFNRWRKAIGCRVTAPALEGRANRAVIAVIAKMLEIPESTVHIQSGATSPVKKILIEGMSKPHIVLWLESLLDS